MSHIVAIIHGEPGAYGVSYPDFPGLASGGETIEDALRRSKEGLNLHIEAMLEDGDALPRLRAIEEIKADPDMAEDMADMAAFALIEYDLPGKPIRVNISMDERLIERIDTAAKRRGMTRSGFLAEAARTAISQVA